MRLTYGGEYRSIHYPHNDMFSDLREVQVSWRYCYAERGEDGRPHLTRDLTERLRETFGKENLSVVYAAHY